MKHIVQFSGGKDSAATLILVVNKYGPENVLAVFTDTGFEDETTVPYIIDFCKRLNVELKILKSKKFNNLLDMAYQKNKMPTRRSRFCTSELKVKPFIDWLIDEVHDNVIIYQGIRASESKERAAMNAECRYFKYYFEHYTINKRNERVYHNYRSKEVKEWCKLYDDSLRRPVFNLSGQDVINIIIANNLPVHPLYLKGAQRVGCFPCVLSAHSSTFNMFKFHPERMEYLEDFERNSNLNFFPKGYIPDRFCSIPRINSKGVEYYVPSISDVRSYLFSKEFKLKKYEGDETPACHSYYHLCE